MDIAVVTEEELRRIAGIDRSGLAVIENAFASLVREQVEMPPVLRLDVPQHNGEMDVKTAYIPGFPYFALKVSCGFFNNPQKGLPSLGGLMNLFDAETGQVVAVLLDNGYLTDIRTALAGAVAAKYLARKDAGTAGVIGTGLQARLQVEALKLVRDIDEVLVWGRSSAKAEQYVEEMQTRLPGVTFEVAKSAENVVERSDIVITTTPAKDPVLKADWLRPGLHVTAMGSDAPEKNELEPNILVRADLFACDRLQQSATLGELHHALKTHTVKKDFPAVEIGEIITGNQPGRENDDQVTVCDLTGTGVQDTAIANYAYQVLNKQDDALTQEKGANLQKQRA